MLFTQKLNNVRNLTCLNIVDNSAIGQQVKEAGKKVKIINILNKTRHRKGGLGDRVVVTILGGIYHGVMVGCTATQPTFTPRFDKNNVVLIDKNNVPLGTRITSPIPNKLRKQGALTARLMAIGTRFV